MYVEPRWTIVTSVEACGDGSIDAKRSIAYQDLARSNPRRYRGLSINRIEKTLVRWRKRNIPDVQAPTTTIFLPSRLGARL